MKKKLLFIPVIIGAGFLALNVNAQTTGVSNLNFEKWTVILGIDLPDGWYAQLGTKNTTNPMEGTYSLKLTTGENPIPGKTDTVPGYAVIGSINMTTGQINQGEPFNLGRPDSLNGYVRYDIKPGDKAYIWINMTRRDTINNTTETVVNTVVNLTGTQNTWINISMPVVYSSNSIPDSIAIIFSSGGKGLFVGATDSLIPGSYLEVDNFKFIGGTQPSRINDLANDFEFKMYPNPVNADELNIKTSYKGEASVEIYDILGKHFKSERLKGDITKINTKEFSEGTYIYQIIDGEGGLLKSGKFSVVR